MSQKNASKILPAAFGIPFGHSWHNTKTPSVVRNGLSAVTMPSRSVPVPINPQWGTESYSGENVGHRPGERAAVLPRATIGITEIAIRFQNEITLAATITPRPRAMRDDRRPPTLRNCTELSTAPRVSARAFPVDANLRDLARLHAGHGAILRFNQSLGYGKLFRHPTAVRRGVGGFRVA